MKPWPENPDSDKMLEDVVALADQMFEFERKAGPYKWNGVDQIPGVTHAAASPQEILNELSEKPWQDPLTELLRVAFQLGYGLARHEGDKWISRLTKPSPST